MTTISLIRGSHANEFELQNYLPLSTDYDIRVVTSHHPLSTVSLPQVPLWSPTDLPLFPFRRQLLNRLIGGEQWLVGFDQYVENVPRPHIIHTAETYTPYTHQAVNLRMRGKIDKLVCTCWETIPHNNEKLPLFRHWKKEAYQYVDIFHTPTLRAKKALMAEGVSESRIIVIPYGVDPNRFYPVLKKTNNDLPLVLTVARLTPEKGIADLISVASHLMGEANFLLLGSGEYQIASSNIRVEKVEYPMMPQYYQKADIFFLPSRTTPTWEEQYGMSLIEAKATGLPIVATDSGAIGEVLAGYGTLVPEGGVTEMVRAIRKILTQIPESPQIASNKPELAYRDLCRLYSL